MSPTYDEHYDHEFVICPYCKGHHDGREISSESEFNEDFEEIQCDHCEEIFLYQCHFTRSYSSAPYCKLNGKTCVPTPNNPYPEFPRCETCGQRIKDQKVNKSPS